MVKFPKLRYQAKLNPIFFLLFLFSIVYAAIQLSSVPFWLGCYLIYFLTFFFGVGMGLHRLVAHEAAQIPKIIFYPSVFLGSLANVGTPINWFLGHNLHHKFADKAEDPILPTLKGFNHVLGAYSDGDQKEMTKILLLGARSPILNDRFLRSLNDHFYYYLLGTYFILFVVGGLPLLFMFIIGSLAALVATSFLTFWSHHPRLGFKRTMLPNHSVNMPGLFWLFFGEEIHNNHHAKPKSPTNSVVWWEIDPIGLFILLVKKQRVHE